MADCSNVEIRELLPERAGGALSVADAARIDAHLAGCALCSSELVLIRSARRALRVTPTIDLARIRGGVIAATAAPSRPQLVETSSRAAAAQRRPRLRWIGLKAAAAVAIAAAGIGSFAVWNSANEGAGAPDRAAVAALAATPGDRAPEELGFAGGLTDLSETELHSLLGDIGDETGGLSAIPFDEPDAITPSVGTDAVTEST